MTIFTVSQLNRYISFKLKEDKNLHGILIKGEISNFSANAASGHLYFSLKDTTGSVKAVMFSSAASSLRFTPQNGMNVIISANVQVYERDGVYQLYVNDIQPDGIGAEQLAVNQLKEKLAEKGIFDETHKSFLPRFPQNIAIVTSIDAAALQDMLNILARRYPIANVRIFTCSVQGENAPKSICNAIEKADKAKNDIVIVGRGGGSAEDLSAFNNEAVVMAVYNCKTPIISAVGHETDTTLSDYAADLRAPTPSAAAELAAPDINELKKTLDSAEFTMKKRFEECLGLKKTQINLKESKLYLLSPRQKILSGNAFIEEKSKRLDINFKSAVERKNALLNEKIAVIEQLSPLKIMKRGYSLVYKNDMLVNSSDLLEKGDVVDIRLSDGTACAKII